MQFAVDLKIAGFEASSAVCVGRPTRLPGGTHEACAPLCIASGPLPHNPPCADVFTDPTMFDSAFNLQRNVVDDSRLSQVCVYEKRCGQDCANKSPAGLTGVEERGGAGYSVRISGH